ncbi:hypothetical protein PSCT_04528 [Pseudomonas sp. SCT]|nr:hypothetical protein PSCT_04528 [Pseudomonas sp. SCT]
MLQLRAPSEHVRAGDCAELSNLIHSKKIAEILEISSVCTPGTGIVQIRKPLSSRRKLSEPLKLYGRQPALGASTNQRAYG